MTTTFDSVVLPNASKIDEEPVIALTDTLLLSGLHSIQTNTNMGFGAKYRCLGTWAQYKALLAKVGASGSLVTTQETYTKCYISRLHPFESDNPSKFYFDVEFKEETI